MKIVFCWSTLSGYMAACWRELVQRPDVELFVVVHRAGSVSEFGEDLLKGIPHRLLEKDEQLNCGLIKEIVVAEKPDIIAMTGWWLKPYRDLTRVRRLAGAKFIMGVDTPWRSEWQFLNRIRRGSFFKRLDHVVVSGERSWQYVRRLGFLEEQISRGMYGVDVEMWGKVAKARMARTAWPRDFLFLGRYAPIKGIDILVEAYKLYRQAVDEPWGLTCCGKGPLENLLDDVFGIKNLGFVQPDDLPSVMEEAGAFVLPSRSDPWPLALVEAAAAGLPLLATEACGSSVEVLRPFYNGQSIVTGSVSALLNAMVRMHLMSDLDRFEWSRRSCDLAEPYSTAIWADRWLQVIRGLTGTHW